MDLKIEAPWVGEQNRFLFQYLGFPCEVLRQPLGYLCGYVSVPPRHPWHGLSYLDIPDVDVHGGLTISRANGPNWTVGFDCAHHMDLIPHHMDLIPELKQYLHKLNGVYRTFDYVRRETENLARQAARAGAR